MIITSLQAGGTNILEKAYLKLWVLQSEIQLAWPETFVQLTPTGTLRNFNSLFVF